MRKSGATKAGRRERGRVPPGDVSPRSNVQREEEEEAHHKLCPFVGASDRARPPAQSRRLFITLEGEEDSAFRAVTALAGPTA